MIVDFISRAQDAAPPCHRRRVSLKLSIYVNATKGV